MAIKKLKTVLPAVFNQITPSATFLSVMGYTNNYGELSNFGLVFHANYMKAVREAVNVWFHYSPKDELERMAKRELLDSFRDTLRGKSHSKVANIYSEISDGKELIQGVKFHDRTDTIHLTGFLIHKKILKPGVYPAQLASPKTEAKDRLRALTRLSRFRQYKLTERTFKHIGVEQMRLTHHALLKDLI